ncbi:FIVAR domain-containing protein [Peptoniphilus obesi]|uniref:FIVAR domain-containing protein n=1 Tax=Peptoniphilus obesi TaxID=1472765 RepID=UPI0004B1C3E3|nr:FIVAR domain-containing protein [Peptoniphilus obesi]
MIKKITSVTLASVLLLSVATPVKAEEAKEVKEEVKVEQKIEDKKEEAKEEIKEVKEEAKEVKEEVKEEVKKEEVRKVKATTQKVRLDDKDVVIYGYNIDGENYFKLRDVAAVLKDSKVKFGVEYKDGLVTLTKGADYKVLDTDQKEVKAESEAMLTNDKVKVGETDLTAKAFKIDGNNYYRVRDLGKALDFGVDYDEEANTVLLSSEKVAENKEVKEALKKEVAKEETVKATKEFKEAKVEDQAKYEEALAAAKSIVDDKIATDEQVENALKALKEAEEKLGLKEEKAEVKEEKKAEDKKEVKEDKKVEEKEVKEAK